MLCEEFLERQHHRQQLSNNTYYKNASSCDGMCVPLYENLLHFHFSMAAKHLNANNSRKWFYILLLLLL